MKHFNTKEVGILLLFIILSVTTVFVIPLGSGPDESMRYQICLFIYKYGNLPRGDDPRIINDIWGISYAFTPINSYIVSGMLMRICGLFGMHGNTLMYVARMVSVCFSCGTVVFCFGIGKRLFKGVYKWAFILGIILLPEFIYISSYVNCDSLALFCGAWIIYALISGSEKEWDLGSCIFLGIGIGLCVLSYYNAYGIIVGAVVYCLISVVLNDNISNKIFFIIQRVAVVTGVALVISGWWFVRNYLLYNGDLLGINASTKCAEINAQWDYKPSNRETPNKLGYSLKYMLFEMKWIANVKERFVAAFGILQFYLKKWQYNLYYIFVIIGLAGCGLNCIYGKKHGQRNDDNLKRKELYSKQMDMCMLLICIITIAISIYYSYFNDFQAQGRYCLPMLPAMMILIVRGMTFIGKGINKYVGEVIATMWCIFMFYIAVYSVFAIIAVVY